MKRIALCLIVMGIVLAGTKEPAPLPDPLPVEVKPVLVSAAKLWSIRNDKGIQPVAYYQRVTMPDGTTQELKSRTPLTVLQWQALAQKQWDAQLAAEAAKPKPCTHCGGSGIEP